MGFFDLIGTSSGGRGDAGTISTDAGPASESLRRHPGAEKNDSDDVFVGQVDELAEKIRQSAFYLVVLGEFKRGKNTLINAILKDNILPTAVVPLTSIVTMIRYGPEEEILVRFKDGKTQTIEDRKSVV